MKATQKYFWVVMALFLVQILLGALTAHYQVEREEFYGADLSQWLPYSLTRSWHTQLAVLWIATAWLGTGLYIAPAISGHEPKFQRLGVNVLFLPADHRRRRIRRAVVRGDAETGSGQQLLVRPPGLGIHRHRPLLAVVPVRRPDHVAGAVGRALWPALRRKDDMASIVTLLFLSTIAIGLLYGAGLMWGEHTHIADRRVLALVGGAPVGGRVLRGVRRGRDQLPVREARPGARHVPPPSTCCSPPSCSWPAACSARSTIFTGRARPLPCSRWAPASPRWK
jgi:hypothetical protein